MDYILTITPSIRPGERHVIEDCLKKLGYNVHGGGTMLIGKGASDISFSDENKEAAE